MANNFFFRWTFNCAFGELAGIGAAGAIAYLVNTSLGEPETLGLKLFVLFAMMLAGAIEGSLLGFFQWRVLKDKFTKVPKWEWIGYTIAIAVLGWFLGMLPSLFFIPSEPVSPDQSAGINLEQPVLYIGLSVAAGLVLGALFGLFQWFSLRKYAQKAWKWILANALGWGLGLAWIYIVAALPPEGNPIYVNVGLGITGGVLAGLSVGAVTGRFLISMRERE